MHRMAEKSNYSLGSEDRDLQELDWGSTGVMSPYVALHELNIGVQMSIGG